MREIGHFVGGKAVKGCSGRYGDVFDPNTGEVAAKVALAKHAEVEHAIVNAEVAQPAWAATNPQRRARVMFKFLELVSKEVRESLHDVCLASIGPVTSATLSKSGFTPTVEALEYTMSGLVKAIAQYARESN